MSLNCFVELRYDIHSQNCVMALSLNKSPLNRVISSITVEVIWNLLNKEPVSYEYSSSFIMLINFFFWK